MITTYNDTVRIWNIVTIYYLSCYGLIFIDQLHWAESIMFGKFTVTNEDLLKCVISNICYYRSVKYYTVKEFYFYKNFIFCIIKQ